MGFIIRGFIWDIPILIFAFVLFWGPIIGLSKGVSRHVKKGEVSNKGILHNPF